MRDCGTGLLPSQTLPYVPVGSSYKQKRQTHSLTTWTLLQASLLAAFTECLCMKPVDQPLTVDVQISKLVNFIVDSNVWKVGQARVRAPGGGFLMKNKTKSLRQTIDTVSSHMTCASRHEGCYGNDASAGVASLKRHSSVYFHIYWNSPGWLVSVLQLEVSGWYHKDWLLYLDTYDGRSLHNLQTHTHTKEWIKQYFVQACTSKPWAKLHHHTFTLEALFDQTPQQTPTMVTEGGTHVVVRLEAVRHVDFKALLLELQGQTQTHPSARTLSSPVCPCCLRCRISTSRFWLKRIFVVFTVSLWGCTSSIVLSAGYCPLYCHLLDRLHTGCVVLLGLVSWSLMIIICQYC